jgi:hypothetical protein
MTSETGTYFKVIYSDIVKRLPSFPIDDPSQNLQDCIKPDYVNFVRAETLAETHSLPKDVITHLQELSLMQYMWDYNNLEGFEKLIQEYHISQKERIRIGLLILNEKEYPCFSFNRNTLNTIDENWAGNYGIPFQVEREVKEANKPNFISRFITWLKNLFKKKEAR